MPAPLKPDLASVQMRGPGDACVSGTITSFDATSRGPGDQAVRGLQVASAKVSLH